MPSPRKARLVPLAEAFGAQHPGRDDLAALLEAGALLADGRPITNIDARVPRTAAIRIQPDSAQLWIELARCHLKEGNAAQAEQFARKALLFTGNRYDLEQQAWVVIADARAEKH